MTFNNVAAIRLDSDLRLRIVACAAIEDIPNPEQWAEVRAWDFASTPGWAEQWAYGVAANVERPGRDEGVITDGDILGRVQQLREAELSPEGDPE